MSTRAAGGPCNDRASKSHAGSAKESWGCSVLEEMFLGGVSRDGVAGRNRPAPMGGRKTPALSAAEAREGATALPSPKQFAEDG